MFRGHMKRVIYRLIRWKQDNLKRRTDRRFEGLWMAPAPKLLDAQELLAGDVLFCGQAKRDKVTELIQNTTDGVYVHCGIYVGDDTVVDAVGAGVREVSLVQFVSDYAYVAVTRSPGANRERSKEIAQFARRCVNAGLRYNYIGAVLAPLREYLNIRKHYNVAARKRLIRVRPRRPKAARRSYFCSEFVVQCYIECGYIGQEHSYFQSGCWSPTGLAEENMFGLVGFMSTGGLAAVDPADPHIGGQGWVLTPEGQTHLNESQERLAARLEALFRSRFGVGPR
jgi:hypothetical protein